MLSNVPIFAFGGDFNTELHLKNKTLIICKKII